MLLRLLPYIVHLKLGQYVLYKVPIDNGTEAVGDKSSEHGCYLRQHITAQSIRDQRAN